MRPAYPVVALRSLGSGRPPRLSETEGTLAPAPPKGVPPQAIAVAYALLPRRAPRDVLRWGTAWSVSRAQGAAARLGWWTRLRRAVRPPELPSHEAEAYSRLLWEDAGEAAHRALEPVARAALDRAGRALADAREERDALEETARRLRDGVAAARPDLADLVEVSFTTPTPDRAPRAATGKLLGWQIAAVPTRLADDGSRLEAPRELVSAGWIPGLPDYAYERLGKALDALGEPVAHLPFEEVEKRLGFALPPPAREPGGWWSGPPGARHLAAWRGGGWEVSSVDLASRSVVFRKPSAMKAKKKRSARASDRRARGG